MSEEAIEVGAVRHVSLHAGDIFPDLLNGCGQFSVAAAGDEDVCAFADKLPGGREADAAIAARNERDFSFKLAHVFLLRVTE